MLIFVKIKQHLKEARRSLCETDFICNFGGVCGFSAFSEEGAACRWFLHHSKAEQDKKEEEETEKAFGALVAAECFYLAEQEVSIEAVIKIKKFGNKHLYTIVFEPRGSA